MIDSLYSLYSLWKVDITAEKISHVPRVSTGNSFPSTGNRNVLAAVSRKVKALLSDGNQGH